MALTAPGQVLGTIDYMAPELLDGERVGAATDIYGLACLAVETLTGTVPFLRDTDAATMYAHIVEPPPSVSRAPARAAARARRRASPPAWPRIPMSARPRAGALVADMLAPSAGRVPACLAAAA